MSNGLTKYNKAFFGHPKPLGSLFFAELWERFSIYGIIPLLTLYMAAMVSDGGMGLDRATASAIVGIFSGFLYLIAIFGGWIADRWLGQARSIWYGSMIIASGHLSIALDALFNEFFFYLGLVLIVLGTGLFKTCISVIIGQLYTQEDSRRDAGFLIFYMGINLGALIAPIFTGFLSENYGWHWGFGIGGLGMLISLLIFRFISIPQLKYFNQLRASENTHNTAINRYHSAPKFVVSFIVILSIFIVIIAMGVITINPVVVLQYLTAITIIILIAYFAYLLGFSKYAREKENFDCFTFSDRLYRILVCF